MRDAVRLNGLTFFACHGALPHERTVPQEFQVDVEILTDLKPAGVSDRLTDTVDYALIARRVRQVMEGESRQLLEALAESIAESLLSLGPTAAVRVRVKKTAPPLGILAQSAEVEIFREA